jgi:hypothetical protein
MRELSTKLQEFISDVKSSEKIDLTEAEERLFRSLKTQGERATKGRLISRCVFEAKAKRGTALMMIMEGRHSMSVGRQVARRFEEDDELKFVEVVKTRSGAYVILRAKEIE